MNVRSNGSNAGDSDMSRSFGAGIKIGVQGGSLSLMIAREHSPRGVVQGVGGKVVIELSPTAVIAALPPATQLGLRFHPDLCFIGPVTLDPARYTQFVSSLQRPGPTRTT